MGKIELPIEKIVEKFENGVHVKDIADEYTVSERTIYNRIDEYYEKDKKIKVLRKRVYQKNKLPIEDIVEKYESGMSIIDISKEYGVGYELIVNRLKDYYKEQGKKMPKILKSLNILKKYLRSGMTMEQIIEIAYKKNVIIPQSLINKQLKSNDIPGNDER